MEEKKINSVAHAYIIVVFYITYLLNGKKNVAYRGPGYRFRVQHEKVACKKREDRLLEIKKINSVAHALVVVKACQTYLP